MKPGTEITPRLLTKLEAELSKLLTEKADLDAQIRPLWGDLRMARLAGIRGDLALGPLPALVGVDPLERQGQENAERVERANHAITVSPQHQAALRDLNSAA
jgi:hypothetical protein